MSPAPEHRVCALVPCYDHAATVAGVVGTLRGFMPVIVVDDGSTSDAAAVIAALGGAGDAADAAAGEHPVTVIRHEVNRGKGAAIITGLKAARQGGFTHALQADADAQHDLGATPRFVEASRAAPGAMVLGYPQYDDSIPRSRYYGRYLTHAWVWINSLSFKVKDSMCGFRIYPVDTTLDIAAASRGRIATRMAFDIEICVRAVRRGVAVVNEPVRVHYPAGGKSHFRLLRDNAEISWMHTRCFFAMLASLPRMLLGGGRR